VSNAASLRYEAALALPKEPAEAIALMALAYRILFAVCFALWAIVGIYDVLGETWSVLKPIGDWLWALPFGVLLLATIRIQESWLTRTKSFKISSASLVVGNAMTSGTRIG